MQHRENCGRRLNHLRIIFITAFIALAPLGLAQAETPTKTKTTQTVTTTTLDRIRASSKLVLGYRNDAPPMSYQDQSGQAAGYSVALCQKIADDIKAELGLQNLVVEWVPSTSAAGVQDVQQGKVDLLCGADVASLAQRANVSFSAPIFLGGTSALIRSDASKDFHSALENRPVPYKPVWRASPSSPLQHKKISVVAGTPVASHIKDRLSKLQIAGTIQTVNSYEDAVAQVAKRNSDVLFGDRARLLSLAKNNADASKLRVLTRHFTYEPIALSLARNNDDFRLIVDRSLSQFYASPKFGEVYVAAFGAADADTIEYFRGISK